MLYYLPYSVKRSLYFFPHPMWNAIDTSGLFFCEYDEIIPGVYRIENIKFFQNSSDRF